MPQPSRLVVNPIAVGIVIALTVGLIGWGILAAMSRPASVDQTSASQPEIEVVPAQADEQPSQQSGSALQNSQSGSLDGSTANDVQQGSDNLDTQNSTELLNQIEQSDAPLSVE